MSHTEELTDQINGFIARTLIDLAEAEENDLRAALAAFNLEPEHVIRVETTDVHPTVRREGGRYFVEMPSLIVLTERCQRGTASPGRPDWFRFAAVHYGQRYTVGLLHPEENAKLPAPTHPPRSSNAPTPDR